MTGPAASPGLPVLTPAQANDELTLRIDEVRGWGLCLRSLGAGSADVARLAVHAIGEGVVALADSLEDVRADLALVARGSSPPAFHAACEPRTASQAQADERPPQPDAALIAACRELDAVKDWQNACRLDDEDPRLVASGDRDMALCALIADTKAWTALGIAAKARVLAREYGFRRPLVEAEAGDNDRDKLLLSLLRDIQRGPATADWQRGAS